MKVGFCSRGLNNGNLLEGFDNGNFMMNLSCKPFDYGILFEGFCCRGLNNDNIIRHLKVQNKLGVSTNGVYPSFPV